MLCTLAITESMSALANVYGPAEGLAGVDVVYTARFR
jgi:hypothetical protein